MLEVRDAEKLCIKEDLLRVKKSRKASKRIISTSLIIGALGLTVNEYLVSKGCDGLVSLYPMIISYGLFVLKELNTDMKATRGYYDLFEKLSNFVPYKDIDSVIENMLEHFDVSEHYYDENPIYSLLNDSNEVVRQYVDNYYLEGYKSINTISEYRDYLVDVNEIDYEPELYGTEIRTSFTDGREDKIIKQMN